MPPSLTNCFTLLPYSQAATLIRHSLSHSVFHSLSATLVLTKLDFGNATLARIPSFQLNRLQAVMNAAARPVFQSSRRDHITPLLHRLHWLRAPERIAYKQAVLYQCLHGLAPTYLADDLQPVTELPGRQRLRSSSTSALVVPPTRRRTIGNRAFPIAAAKTWNSLPPEVTSSESILTFKINLKLTCFPCPSLISDCKVTEMQVLHLFT